MADTKSVTTNSHRGLEVFLGILLVIFSFIMLSSVVVTTFASIYFIGWIFAITGVVAIAQGLFSGHLDSAVLGVLGGVLGLIIGLVMINNPEMSAATLTLLVGVMLMVSGAYRGIVAIFQRGPGWVATLIWGILTFTLGLIVWQQWPVSGYWLVGTFVGIEFLILGINALFGLSGSRAIEHKSAYS